ncbi:hypothetical protein [Vibrio sp. EA2]|uniref:hypothetical protein n=1 Tax=Vibrio sp. EA2 TaxID=3079860 RepID=UPI002949F33E|nr:hypothetical protein [Vibrio sp. EA2]MDV6251777.1 hypothetical protein [Vibrio sp. EA2]
MSLLISRHRAPHKQAKWLLAIIGWVIVVCLMQNSGFVTSCSMKGEQVASSVVSAEKSHDTEAKSANKCELSEKLILFAKHHLGFFIVVLFVGISLVAVCRRDTFSPFSQWTEPIRHKHRVHLTFCVFRE